MVLVRGGVDADGVREPSLHELGHHRIHGALVLDEDHSLSHHRHLLVHAWNKIWKVEERCNEIKGEEGGERRRDKGQPDTNTNACSTDADAQRQAGE